MCPLNITFAWGVVPGNLGGLLVTHTLEQCVPKKANFWLNVFDCAFHIIIINISFTLGCWVWAGGTMFG